ncbi:MAG: LysO family transporter [Desulforegulaceae bacterium]|nr:LysO family transporter [Desulforegulaceae bacterium]
MLKFFLFLFAGILTGVFLRENKKAISFFEKATMFSIFLLLFLFGAEAGLDEKIKTTFYSSGVNGILISISAIAGSIVFSIPVYFFIFRKKEEKK